MDAKSIIEALGGRAAVATATGAERNTVTYWERRGRIPADYWNDLIRLARSIKGCGVTDQTLREHLALRRQGSDPQAAA